MDQFLTWNDVNYITKEMNRLVLFSPVILPMVAKSKKDARLFQNIINRIGYERIGNMVPDNILKLNDYEAVLLRDETGKYRVCIDPTFYINSFLLTNCIKQEKIEKELIDSASNFFDNVSKNREEAIISYKKRVKKLLIELRNNANLGLEGKMKFAKDGKFMGPQYYNDLKNDIFWILRNFDTLMDGLLSPIEGIDEEELLSYIDNEKFFSYLTYNACCIAGFAEEELENEEYYRDPALLKLINKYKAYMDYRKRLDPEFDSEVIIVDDTGRYLKSSAFELVLDIDDFYDNVPKYNKDDYGVYENDDILEELPDCKKRKMEEDKKKRVEAFRKEILLTWEIVPETTSNPGEGRTMGIKSVKEDHSKELEERREKVLQEKLEVLEDSNYVTLLKGTNHLEGYVAHVYPTGKVILEKFFKNTRHGLVPTIDEAAFVMNLSTFLHVSKLEKHEIRDYVKSDEYPDLNVIYHTKNYKKKILKEISDLNYTEDTLDYIEGLLSTIEVTNGKTNE